MTERRITSIDDLDALFSTLVVASPTPYRLARAFIAKVGSVRVYSVDRAVTAIEIGTVKAETRRVKVSLRKTLTDEERDEILSSVEPASALSNALGVTVTAINAVRRDAKLTGEQVAAVDFRARARLTDEEREMIEQSELSDAELAEEFAVSRQAIHAIRKQAVVPKDI